MSEAHDRFENDRVSHPDWLPESRLCPFDELPIRFCGCPVAERMMDEAHLIRGSE